MSQLYVKNKITKFIKVNSRKMLTKKIIFIKKIREKKKAIMIIKFSKNI